MGFGRPPLVFWDLCKCSRVELLNLSVGVGEQEDVPSGKLTWQWKMGLLKMHSLSKVGIFHCHVSLLECKGARETSQKLVTSVTLPETNRTKVQLVWWAGHPNY